jgi:hypothetical protein
VLVGGAVVLKAVFSATPMTVAASRPRPPCRWREVMAPQKRKQQTPWKARCYAFRARVHAAHDDSRRCQAAYSESTPAARRVTERVRALFLFFGGPPLGDSDRQQRTGAGSPTGARSACDDYLADHSTAPSLWP